MKKQLNGQATPEQIEQWKKDNPAGIYAISLHGHIAYFRNPEIMDMNAATGCTTKDNALDYFTTLANDTYLGGSKAFIDGSNAKWTLDYIETVKEKLEGKKGELVNL
ncbi:MAG: hypothetical protein ACK4EY_16185 [Flavipsychrobacter sp.]